MKKSINNFKICILNNTKKSSTLIYDNLKSYGYDCSNFDDIELFNKYISEHTLDMIILNSDKATDIEEYMIKGIQEISNANIIFLTSQIDLSIKDKFLKLNLLDYKIKMSNILTILSEINSLIKKLILNTRETILVIKKDTSTRRQIETLLKLRHYNIIIASTGSQGWKAIDKAKDLSLIILDLNLNDMDSLEIIDKTKRSFTYNIPVIALTVHYNPIALQQNISNGLSDLIKVPIINEEFNLKIDLWIDNIRQKRELREHQAKLEESLNGFQALANATIEGLIMFDNNICVDANDASLKLFKYNTKDELIGKNILTIVPESLSSYDKQELLKNDVDHEFEIDMIKQDGEIFPTQIKERNININNRQIKIIAILDLTDIKRKEDMLHQQSKLASMGEMMQNIAHQWRQPLSAISIAASGIKLNQELGILDEEDMLEQLDDIVERTEFLSTTISDFQNFLKQNQPRDEFYLKASIEKVLKLINANISAEDILIVQKYEEDFILYGIANEFVQSLLNIINNAKDAMVLNNIKDRIIKIEAKRVKENVELTIHDSANGIPKDIIEKIFEPYFTTKHQSQGTGLGLYMTYQMIVDKMNGKIEVVNKKFKYEENEYFGAEFKLILPLHI